MVANNHMENKKFTAINKIADPLVGDWWLIKQLIIDNASALEMPLIPEANYPLSIINYPLSIINYILLFVVLFYHIPVLFTIGNEDLLACFNILHCLYIHFFIIVVIYGVVE